MISTKGLTQAQVLSALYNAAEPRGMGILVSDSEPMPVAEAQTILDRCNGTLFNYLKGRAIKVHLHFDEFEEYRFDRMYGEGAAQRVIDTLRAGLKTLPEAH